MANTNKPFGLAPVRSISGTWSQQATRYYVYSSDTDPYYIGDAVISAAQGDANGTSGIAKATGAQTLRGVVVGVEPANQLGISLQGTVLDLSIDSIPATKTRAYYVYVVDDPGVVFSIQGDATATNQVATNSNKNFSLTIANGATTVSASATVMSSSTINTTDSLNMKAMGLLQTPGNAYGAYAVWQCKINLHELSASGTTAI
tara:strand:+ start:745 stop:1353 length:609 start_codon:yes stop_codon:yes gene_type:complete